MSEEGLIDFNQPILSVRKLPADFPSKDRAPNVSLPLLLNSETVKSGLVANPGTVPFVWEQSPGRCKNGKEVSPPEDVSGRPRLPPGIPGKESDDNPPGRPSFDSETFEDAAGSVSRSDSFFMNCSISGVSDIDAGNTRTDTDAMTREFMMGRFLPAAEAIASEKPLFSSRKAPVLRTKIAPVSVARTVSRSPVKERVTLFVEDESDEEESDARHVASGKACAWLPRLCMQSSFSILNPIPGLRPPRASKRVPIRQLEANRTSKVAVKAESPYSGKFDSASYKESPTSFRQLLAKEKMEWESDCSSLTVEKNVCIESINCEKYCAGSDGGIDRESTETASTDSSLRDANPISAEEQENKLAIIVIHPQSEAETEKEEIEGAATDEMKKCAYASEIESKISVIGSRIWEDLVVLQSDGVPEGNKRSQNLMLTESCVVAPPLPNSPSESWLHRTLPNVTSKTSASGNLRLPSTRHYRK